MILTGKMKLCHRKMDHETTQKLLRESIVLLCKTHLGHDVRGGFEVDAIICVSRHSDGDNSSVNCDPRPTVFKFHERVTDEDGKAVENVNEWLLSGSTQSFMNGLVKQSEEPQPAEAKRRRIEEQDGQQALSNFDHFGSDGMQTTECMPDLSIVKQEPSCVAAEELTIADVRSTAAIDTSADQPQMRRRLRSADAISFDLGFSRSQSETTGTPKEVSGLTKDSKTATAITELEQLVSQPVMNSSAPAKVTPSAAESKPFSIDEFIQTPVSQSSSSEHHPETVANLVEGNLDDSTSGMEQSTPRSCNLCGSVFADFPTFNVHSAAVHSRYACPFCALLFPCESTRERHLFEHTGESVDDDGTVNVPVEEDDSRGSARPLHQSGNRHSDYWPADMSGSLEMSDGEDGTLTRMNGMLYDPAVVTRRGVLSCQTLRAIAQLDPLHPFVCDVCRARFTGSSELCDHCASVHHRIPCPYCGRSFSQKASMERHQRQHTGERPFQCTLCDSSYTRKENLQTHMSRMHGCSGTQHQSGPDFICVE